jgi:molybdate transport system ATP-binding protein
VSLAARLRVARAGFTLDVELAVDSGETVAVLGPNGSGKTTLLHALAGLVPLDAGRVTLDGLVLDDVAAGVAVPSERRPVAVVFQDLLLFRICPRSRTSRSAPLPAVRATRAAARAWLDRIRLGASRMRATTLSGGQAQRVLARASPSSPSSAARQPPPPSTCRSCAAPARCAAASDDVRRRWFP